MGGISYARAHQRLREQRGSATKWNCIFCGEPAREWSYDHLCPNEKIEHRNGKLYPYSEDQDRYQPVCRGCHVYRDRGFESWDTCLACTSKTRYSYCSRHWIGPRGTPGMPYGHQLEDIDENGRRHALRGRDLIARALVASIMTHKRCNGCAKTLPVDAFAVIRSRMEKPDPYKSICLACDRKKGIAKYRARTGRA